MAEKQYTYKLREDLSVEQIVNFVNQLKNSPRKINKGYLEPGSYPKISYLNFEIQFEKEKQGTVGNVPPYILYNILIVLQGLIKFHAKKKGSPFFLPLEKYHSHEYEVFYFVGKYRDTQHVISPDVQKEMVEAFLKVVQGDLGKEQKKETSDKKADEISEFSYNLRSGDLIENWTKLVKPIASYLLNLDPKEKNLEGQ